MSQALLRVRISGLSQLKPSIEALGEVFKKRTLQAAMIRASKPTVDLARQLAPYDKNRKVGKHLRDSIRASTLLKRSQRRASDDVGTHVYIGASAPHAHLVEFGHDILAGGPRPTTRAGRKADKRQVVGRVPAHPFLRPAWDATAAQVFEGFEAALRKEMNRTLEKIARKVRTDTLTVKERRSLADA